MKFQDLSAADQALLRTDFGPDLEKVAADQAALAQELYQTAFEKIAAEMADSMDANAAEMAKVAEEDEEKDKEPKDEEHEKEAAERGAFIERGVFDGLRKLGSDRHGNPWHYLLPFVEEKVAEAGGMAALKGFYGKMKGHISGAASKGKGHVMGAAHKAKEQAQHASAAGKAHLSAHKSKYTHGLAAAGGAGGGAVAAHLLGKKKEHE